MSTETTHQQPIHNEIKSKTLEELLLLTLEQHDGLCLDHEEERAILAIALANVLIPTLPGEITPKVVRFQ